MKVRFRFTKVGKVRWTSHRDVARMWERALRRASLPVTYTGGFTPRPKISFGLALPTGHESVAEYLDVEFETADLDVASLPARLSLALPAGLDVIAAAAISGPVDSLQESVFASTWEIEAVGAPPSALEGMLGDALAAPSLCITRDRKGVAVTDDVRPAILRASVVGLSPCVAEGFIDHSPGAVMVADLAVHPRSLRPVEFLAAISPELVLGHVRRTYQWILRDGARQEPLSAPAVATDAPHTSECAS